MSESVHSLNAGTLAYMIHKGDNIYSLYSIGIIYLFAFVVCIHICMTCFCYRSTLLLKNNYYNVYCYWVTLLLKNNYYNV